MWPIELVFKIYYKKVGVFQKLKTITFLLYLLTHYNCTKLCIHWKHGISVCCTSMFFHSEHELPFHCPGLDISNIETHQVLVAGTKALGIWGSKEERQPSFHLSRGVFSGSSNFLTLFRCKPVHCHNYVLLSQTTLYIFGEQLGFVSQNGLDCFAFVPSCNQGKLLLSTTNDNFKTLNWMKTKPGRI